MVRFIACLILPRVLTRVPSRSNITAAYDIAGSFNLIIILFYISSSVSEKGGRNDLVAGEQAEIDTIQAFLPKQMNEDEMNKAVAEIIASVNAAGLKDMGKVMAALREQYAGQMDFGQASGIVKNILAQK